ncbi:hypothetical protein Bca101_067773 [Brassica carinata]
MADLSVQTCVVLSEGYNQVVVHGSCGLVDAIPHVRSSFPVLLFWFLLQRLRLLFLIVSLVYVFMPVLSTPELGPFSLVSSLWTAISVWDYVVASLTSLQEAFQALRDVVYEPDLFVVSIRNSPLLFVECFTDGVGYKLCGVHWKTATPETTLEIPASKETWRTSLSCDPRRRLRTASNS